MWPRTEEEHARRRNVGFVSFMKRIDAEMAARALQNKYIHGMQIKLHFSKPVTLPAVPLVRQTKEEDGKKSLSHKHIRTHRQTYIDDCSLIPSITFEK